MGSNYLSSKKGLVPELPRVGIENIHNVDVKQLVDGCNKFAVELYQQMRPEPGNLFYSPYSISAALAMVYAGAGGITAREMAEVLHFTLENKTLHTAFNDLEQYFSALAENKNMNKPGEPFRLNIANAIWGMKDYQINDAFLEVLARDYGAGYRTLDFVKQPQESRQTINQWVYDHTEKRIQNIIPPESITSETRMVLTNAIYFNASWLEPFMQDFTEEGDFYGLGGKVFSAQMMRLATTSPILSYFQGARFKAVDLPYIGGQFAMLVLVPNRGYFPKFEKKLTYQQLTQVISGLRRTPIQLRFPRFEFESEINLVQALAEMGMPSAFSGAADFSGMTGSKDIFISNVFHKALVNVDEKGTEAAAATAVGVLLCATLDKPVVLTVDRPFLFFIRERSTKSILFMGRVVSPR